LAAQRPSPSARRANARSSHAIRLARANATAADGLDRRRREEGGGRCCSIRSTAVQRRGFAPSARLTP
jgi:hypothetical protein